MQLALHYLAAAHKSEQLERLFAVSCLDFRAIVASKLACCSRSSQQGSLHHSKHKLAAIVRQWCSLPWRLAAQNAVHVLVDCRVMSFTA